MPSAPTDFLAILHCLAEHHVEYLVVGGVAAVLQGAPIATFDLDVVHSRQPRNLEKLLQALHALDAKYRAAGDRELRPEHSHLVSSGHQLLLTRYGPLDLLGEIGTSHDYDELAAHAITASPAPGIEIRVLDLAWVIRTKEETAQDKDAAVLPVLRQTLRERGSAR